MLVGKNKENVTNTDLLVDTWTVQYVENKATGEDDLNEIYAGHKKDNKQTEKSQFARILL